MMPNIKADTTATDPRPQLRAFCPYILFSMIFLHSLKPPATIPETFVILIVSLTGSYFTRPKSVREEPSKAISDTFS
jgi:hypothetical protein